MKYTRHFFECEEGNRWSECEWEEDKGFWQGKGVSQNGSYCGFSGCEEDSHKIKLVKSLDGNSEESAEFVKNWFHSIYKDVRGLKRAQKNNLKNMKNGGRHMYYRIFTEDINRSKIEAIVAKHFEGFTVIPCTGFWRLQREQTIIIEILAESAKCYNKVKSICEEIKKVNNQESVMLFKAFGTGSFL